MNKEKQDILLNLLKDKPDYWCDECGKLFPDKTGEVFAERCRVYREGGEQQAVKCPDCRRIEKKKLVKSL